MTIVITLVYDRMLSHSKSSYLTNLIYIYHKNVIRNFIKILLIQKSIDISVLKCRVLDESTTLFINDKSFENVATVVNCYQIHQTQTANNKKQPPKFIFQDRYCCFETFFRFFILLFFYYFEILFYLRTTLKVVLSTKFLITEIF